MLQAVVVMRKRASCVVGWVNKYAFHLAREFLLQRLKREKVVAEDQPVIEDVILSYAMCGVCLLYTSPSPRD